MIKDNQINTQNYDYANEYIVLFESASELVVLYRNIMLNQEFIVMTSSAFEQRHEPSKFMCSFAEYSQLIPYQFKINQYQKTKDNCRLFEAFFNMSIEQFFKSIS